MKITYTSPLSASTVHIIEVSKLDTLHYVRYDEELRPQYTFTSPITGTIWVIRPEGWSSYHQSKWWSADFRTPGHRSLGLGTSGESLRHAVQRALENEEGVY